MVDQTTIGAATNVRVLAGAGGLNGTGGAQGTAAASSEFHSMYNAFNNTLVDGDDCWHSDSGDAVTYISFEFPYNVTVTKYRIWPRNDSTSINPSAWLFQYSTVDNPDESEWTTLETVSGATGMNSSDSEWDADNIDDASAMNYCQEYEVSTTNYATRHIRLNITGSHYSGGHVAIGELGLYGYTATLDVIGDAHVTTDLAVGGSAYIASGLTVGGTLDVSGDANISSDLSVGGEWTEGVDGTGARLILDQAYNSDGPNKIVLASFAGGSDDAYGFGVLSGNTLSYNSASNHIFYSGSQERSTGTQTFKIDENGNCTTTGNLTVGGSLQMNGNIYRTSDYLIGRSSTSTVTTTKCESYINFDSNLSLAGGSVDIKYSSGSSAVGTTGLTVSSSGTDITDNLTVGGSIIVGDGNVGIGITGPTYPLHINSTVDNSVDLYMIGNTADDDGDYDGSLNKGQDREDSSIYSGSSRAGESVVFWYKDNTIQDLDEGNDGGMIWRWNDSTTIPISVYATGAFVSGQTFATTSDRRIKTNIVDISDDEALVQFRKLQPKKYNYIDFKKKTTQQVYGFIAQEIAQEIPNSTTQTSDFIPDLYCYGEVDVCNNTIKLLQKSIIIDSSNQNIVIQDASLNIDLSLNDTLKCCDAYNDEFEIEISNIEIVENIETLDTEYILTIDASNIELSKHSYYNIGDPSGNILHNNLVFVYGKKVDDLHHVKKDSIWTVAAAALQEVDRQQQSDKVRISELETEVVTLETEVTTLKNQVSTFESQITELLARVSSLETNNSTTTDGS